MLSLCHAERSEGEASASSEPEMLPLRCAQGFGSRAQHDRAGLGRSDCRP